jgi:ABC-type molybdate transport system permease subunit
MAAGITEFRDHRRSIHLADRWRMAYFYDSPSTTNYARFFFPLAVALTKNRWPRRCVYTEELHRGFLDSVPQGNLCQNHLVQYYPYWINELLRTFAWQLVLADAGIFNKLLLAVRIISEPINFRAGNGGVIMGMAYAYVLFMVFPLYNAMESLDRNQIDAARDLGASWLRIHRRIVIPHAKPGIAVGCIMSFMLAAGSIAVPQLLGSPSSFWFTQIIYTNFECADWNQGAAYATVLAVLCLVFIMVMLRVFRVSLKDFSR